MTTNFTCVSINSARTPAQLVQKMFDSTVDNILYVNGFPYDENNESDCIYRCVMSWSGYNAEAINRKMTETKDFENRYFSKDIFIRTERQKRLMDMKAPDLVIENEVLLLTMAKVLNLFAFNIEKANLR